MSVIAYRDFGRADGLVGLHLKRGRDKLLIKVTSSHIRLRGEFPPVMHLKASSSRRIPGRSNLSAADLAGSCS